MRVVGHGLALALGCHGLFPFRWYAHSEERTSVSFECVSALLGARLPHPDGAHRVWTHLLNVGLFTDLVVSTVMTQRFLENKKGDPLLSPG